MAVEIPCRTDLPHYDLQVQLSGATYTLAFRWNVRESSWYFDLLTEDGDPIFCGSKVVIGFPLATLTRDARRPPGVFLAFDTAGHDEPPALEDLGSRVVLTYYEPSEI
jgi:hypothetical protein